LRKRLTFVVGGGGGGQQQGEGDEPHHFTHYKRRPKIETRRQPPIKSSDFHRADCRRRTRAGNTKRVEWSGLEREREDGW
jgi:hypothetical protein